MSRFKTFEATGTAPNGRIYAGDLNAIQDRYADLVNYGQNHGVGTLAIGEAGLQLLRFGAGEARLTGKLRLDSTLAHTHEGVLSVAPRIVRGQVNDDGTIAAGTGFTVVKNGDGDFTITFSTAFTNAPIVLVTPLTLSQLVACDSSSTTQCVIHTGTLEPDESFFFIAVGV